MKDTKEKLAELKGLHKRLVHFEVDGVDVVLRKPTGFEFRRFQKVLMDKESQSDDKLQAMEDFATTCCLLPEPEALRAVFDEYPALPGECADALSKLAGNGLQGKIIKN